MIVVYDTMALFDMGFAWLPSAGISLMGHLWGRWRGPGWVWWAWVAQLCGVWWRDLVLWRALAYPDKWLPGAVGSCLFICTVTREL